MTDTAEVTGVVLAGGRGTRAGGPKAAVELEGQTLCQRAVRRLQAVMPQVLVSVREASDPVPAGAVAVADDPVGGGPLVAVTGALEACPTPWAFVAGCDQPDLDADFIRFLIRRACAGTADVVLPIDADGHRQPLHAVYHTAAVPRLRARLQAGERSLVRALDALARDEVPPAAYAHLPNAAASLAGLNTADAIAARRAGAGNPA